MNSVGIDLHRKRSNVAALDAHGGEQIIGVGALPRTLASTVLGSRSPR